MARKTKNYLVTAELQYDYDDEDTGDIDAVLSADGVREEIMSWLEDLGFSVSARVVEYKGENYE